MDNTTPAYPANGNHQYSGLSRLEAFAMAAMQGLCNGMNIRELSANDVEEIAYWSAEVAQRTLFRLSELSKQK